MLGFSNLAEHIHKWKRDQVFADLKQLQDCNGFTIDKILGYLKGPATYNVVAKKNYDSLLPFRGKEQTVEIANLQEKAIEWLFFHYS